MRGTLLATDWQPSEHDRAYGLALGLTNSQIDDMAEDMRLWAGANAHRAIARKANWSMAFKGWMRRVVAKGRKPTYQPRPPLPANYERGNPNNWKQ